MVGVSKPSLVVHLYGTVRSVGHWPVCSSIKFTLVVVCGAEALMHLCTLSHNTIQNVEEMENKTWHHSCSSSASLFSLLPRYCRKIVV